MATPKVNDVSAEAAAMHDDMDLIDALKGGTRTMRAAGIKYLPRRPAEDQEDYDSRRDIATLLPAYSETAGSMVGRVFAKPLALEEAETPERIRELADDIDMQGRNLHAFARDWFEQALDYGLGHVMVESPRVDPSVVRTVADEKAAKVRPYCIGINPRRVLGWQYNEAGELTQLRVRFWIEEPDGEFGTASIEEVRVYEPKRVRLFRKKDATETAAWVQTGEYANALGIIPLVTLYTKRTGKLTGTPPMRELAFLNAKHWRLQCGNDALLDTASVPILVVTGADDDKTILIGAKHAVMLPQGATMAYVEHTGQAIGAGRDALESLKDEMRQSGARLLMPSAEAARTATEAGEDANRENSALGAMAEVLEDTIDQLLDILAKFISEPYGGRVKVQPNLEYDPTPNDSIRVLGELHDKSLLSDESLFSEVQRRGVINEELTWEEEKLRIRENMPPAVLPSPQPVVE